MKKFWAFLAVIILGFATFLFINQFNKKQFIKKSQEQEKVIKLQKKNSDQEEKFEPGQNKEQQVFIKVDPPKRNWGKVFTSKGIATRDFLLENVFSKDIKLLNVSTSCGCTKAEIRSLDNKIIKLPYSLKPGKKLKLIVSYDPNFHQVEGNIERFVYIQTDLDSLPEIEIKNSIKVIKDI